MKKCFLIVAVWVFSRSCTNTDRDNPNDMWGSNYMGGKSSAESSSSIVEMDEPSSSGGEEPSSSSIIEEPSSSSAGVSSSVETDNNPSSSSVVYSSSSAEPSSSSALPSSSSEAESSSSVAPSSSSAVQSSSSSVAASSSSSSSSSSLSVPSSSSLAYSGKGNSISNYKTVVIGTQRWMAENLNYAVEGSKCYGEGGEVAIGEDEEGNPTSTTTLSVAEVQANCDKYGRLYDWATAMALPSSCNSSICSDQVNNPHRGICPSGWHIPSNEEWEELVKFAGDFSSAGEKLKATSGWNSHIRYNKNGYYSVSGGTDQYGFSALPGGGGNSGGSFYYVGYYGRWWSASENDSDDAYYKGMLYNAYGLYGGIDFKSFLFSVRCLQD
jgi:uncharacterized protein (TIGR02145 family)